MSGGNSNLEGYIISEDVNTLRIMALTLAVCDFWTLVTNDSVFERLFFHLSVDMLVLLENFTASITVNLHSPLSYASP